MTNDNSPSSMAIALQSCIRDGEQRKSEQLANFVAEIIASKQLLGLRVIYDYKTDLHRLHGELERARSLIDRNLERLEVIMDAATKLEADAANYGFPHVED